MKLRGIDFGPCWDAAGVRGWFGEGYWFHFLAPRWYDLQGSTKVAKTTTMFKNAGNMPLQGSEQNYAPKEMFPRCIWWSWWSGRTLNSVGLSGPGVHALAGFLFWRNLREPFMVSYMSVRPTIKERLEEFTSFAAFFMAELRGTTVLTRIALQINISCPNTGLDTSHLIEEARNMLDISAQLPIPKILKINILPPPETVAEIVQHPECDALCFTNALPFGSLPNRIPWQKLFPNGSPLAARSKSYGGGGYSGPELLPLVCEYSAKLRSLGIDKPFNLGGGIRKAADVDYAVRHGKLRRGGDSIFFASAAMVRPWNLRPIINRAHELLG